RQAEGGPAEAGGAPHRQEPARVQRRRRDLPRHRGGAQGEVTEAIAAGRRNAKGRGTRVPRPLCSGYVQTALVAAAAAAGAAVALLGAAGAALLAALAAARLAAAGAAGGGGAAGLLTGRGALGDGLADRLAHHAAAGHLLADRHALRHAAGGLVGHALADV